MRSAISRSGTATSREIHIGSSTRTTLFVDEPPLQAGSQNAEVKVDGPAMGVRTGGRHCRGSCVLPARRGRRSGELGRRRRPPTGRINYQVALESATSGPRPRRGSSAAARSATTPGTAHIVTAAHCVFDNPRRHRRASRSLRANLDVLVGTRDAQPDGGGRRAARRRRVSIDPDYDPATPQPRCGHADARGAAHLDGTEPADLPSRDRDAGWTPRPASARWSRGWGTTTAGTYPTTLRGADVPFASDPGLPTKWHQGVDTSIEVCAGTARQRTRASATAAGRSSSARRRHRHIRESS